MSPEEPWHVQISLSDGSNMQPVAVSVGTEGVQWLPRV